MRDWIGMRRATPGLCDEVSVEPWVDGMYGNVNNVPSVYLKYAILLLSMIHLVSFGSVIIFHLTMELLGIFI